MRTPFLLAIALVALSACDSHDSSPLATAPSATPTIARNLPPTSSPIADSWRNSSKLTSTDATASIPAERDGRRLSAVGGYGDEVLLEATKEVPYLPGDVIGQGAKAHDQEFMLWDPVKYTFRPAWTNQSLRFESVLGIDGDWVLSELYRLNPGNFWILRLRNLVTGEVRDIDQESEDARGMQYPASPQINAGRVVYVRVDGSSDAKRSSILIYEIATATVTNILEKDWNQDAGGTLFALATIDGDRLVWSSDSGHGISTTILDLQSKQERVIADPRIGSCHLVSGSQTLACNGAPSVQGPVSQADAERITAYELDDDSVHLLTTGGHVPERSWGGWFSTGTSLWNATTREDRALDPEKVGASARVLDGWFTWIDWQDDSSGRRDFASSSLHVLKLQ